LGYYFEVELDSVGVHFQGFLEVRVGVFVYGFADHTAALVDVFLEKHDNKRFFCIYSIILMFENLNEFFEIDL
jgi:hypothetical protein